MIACLFHYKGRCASKQLSLENLYLYTSLCVSVHGCGVNIAEYLCMYMHHSVFVLKQLSYLREGGMAHRWARRRPASVSVATGTSHPAVPDFRPAAAATDFRPAASLLLASFSTTFTCGSVTLAGLVWCDCEKELLWPTLISASLGSEEAKAVRRGGSVLSATSSD